MGRERCVEGVRRSRRRQAPAMWPLPSAAALAILVGLAALAAGCSGGRSPRPVPTLPAATAPTTETVAPTAARSTSTTSTTPTTSIRPEAPPTTFSGAERERSRRSARGACGHRLGGPGASGLRDRRRCRAAGRWPGHRVIRRRLGRHVHAAEPCCPRRSRRRRGRGRCCPHRRAHGGDRHLSFHRASDQRRGHGSCAPTRIGGRSNRHGRHLGARRADRGVSVRPGAGRALHDHLQTHDAGDRRVGRSAAGHGDRHRAHRGSAAARPRAL